MKIDDKIRLTFPDDQLAYVTGVITAIGTTEYECIDYRSDIDGLVYSYEIDKPWDNRVTIIPKPIDYYHAD